MGWLKRILKALVRAFLRALPPAARRYVLGELTRVEGSDQYGVVEKLVLGGGKRVRLLYRRGTLDESIFDGIEREYRVPELVARLDGARAASGRAREPVVVDVGGHVGSFSLILGAALGGAKLRVYEVVPENAKLVRANLLLNDLAERAEVFNVALGDRSGLFVRLPDGRAGDPNTGGLSIVQSDPVGEQAKSATPGRYVETRSSKEILRDLDRVDILKIDCEGSEYRILYNLDARDFERISAIVGEVHDAAPYHGLTTNGMRWESKELLAYLGKFYKSVLVHETHPVAWGFMQVFTATDPAPAPPS